MLKKGKRVLAVLCAVCLASGILSVKASATEELQISAMNAEVGQDDVDAAAARSYGDLIYSIAVQPESKDTLLSVKEKLSPPIQNLESEKVQVARAEALSNLYLSVAKRPEMGSELCRLFEDYLGGKPENPSERVQAAAVKSLGVLIEAISIDPKVKDTLLALEEQLSPDIDNDNLDSEMVQEARAEALSYLYLNVAKRPEMESELCQLFEDYLGGKPENPSERVQAAAAKSLGALMEAISIQPDAWNTLVALEEQLSPDIDNDNLDSEMLQEARAEALGYLYYSVARQPEKGSELCQLFEDYLGGKPENPSERVQAAAVKSLGALIETISRQPEAKGKLLGLEEQLSPDINNPASEMVQEARAEALSYLYLSVARVPEMRSALCALFEDYLGVKPENPSERVQAAAVKSLGTLIEAISINPEAKNTLLALEEQLSPDISNPDSEMMQAAMTMPCGKVIEALAETPDQRDYFIDILKQLNVYITNFQSEKVQAGSAEALQYLYTKVAGVPDMEPFLSQTFEELLVLGYCLVSFDSDGGTAVDRMMIPYNSSIERPADPTKEGYVLAGWYLGENRFDFNTLITSDITLQAKWTEKVIESENKGDSQASDRDKQNNISNQSVVKKAPNTGSNLMMEVWIALILLSGTVLTGMGVYRRKK